MNSLLPLLHRFISFWATLQRKIRTASTETRDPKSPLPPSVLPHQSARRAENAPPSPLPAHILRRESARPMGPSAVTLGTPGGNWEMTFEDEFLTDASIVGSNSPWITGYPWGQTLLNELEYYTRYDKNFPTACDKGG